MSLMTYVLFFYQMMIFFHKKPFNEFYIIIRIIYNG